MRSSILVFLTLLCWSFVHTVGSTEQSCSSLNDGDETCSSSGSSNNNNSNNKNGENSVDKDETRTTNNDGKIGSGKDRKCSIYFAKSTIPGAGLGMFAGRSFAENERLISTGDVVVPIVDIDLYHADMKETFLWDEYTWSASSLLMDNEGVYEVNAASPGFGAAANCFIDLVNVEEWGAKHSYANLRSTRKDDPGIGGFTPYYDRLATAKIPVEAGQELFVSYGSNWFETRTKSIGPVPIKGHLAKANVLMAKWRFMFNRYKGKPEIQNVIKKLWEDFVWRSPHNQTSRILFAVPNTWEEMNATFGKGLTRLRRQQSTRSLEWLEENGVCADSIYIGNSTIRQAGRGAFAKVPISKGDIIAPMPVIHLPNRRRLEMYERDNGHEKVLNKVYSHQQLLLNYCMGHRLSTILLCPYGLHTGSINHSPDKPNAELRWADPKRSNHDPTWLNRTIDDMKKDSSGKLAFEVVATRDIGADEEIFLNYGDEWEAAWQRHVQSWVPDNETFVSADELNSDLTTPLRTVFEQISQPYPSNVNLKFDLAFKKSNSMKWHKHWASGTLEYFKRWEDEYLGKVEILSSEVENGTIWYNVNVIDTDEKDPKKKNTKVDRVPREAFVFKDKPYTSEFLNVKAFRHDIRIPDHLFPPAWKNRKVHVVNLKDSQNPVVEEEEEGAGAATEG